MQRLGQFLKPDWRKLALFFIFAAIAVGGRIQAWAFSDIPPKPPLYDLLRPVPLWPLWMLLLVPLALLALPLRLVGLDLMGGPPWLFFTANLIYSCLLSCTLIVAVDWLGAKWKSRGA
jgi:hypothetical protein